MASVANEVRSCIERDPYLRKDLARDVINHSKLARWLQRERGIEGAEHAIISALRRWKPEKQGHTASRAQSSNQDGILTVETGMSAITVDANHRAAERVGRLSEALGKSVPVLPGMGTITLILELGDHERGVELLGHDIIASTDEALTLIGVDCHELDADEMAGLVAWVTQALSTCGLTWEHGYVGNSMIHILVDEADHQHALELISTGF